MGKLARTRWVVVALTLGLLAAACAGGEETAGDGGDGGDGGAASGGEFSVFICEPQFLVPTNSNETCGAEVLNALFIGLVEYDPDTSQPLYGQDSDQALAETIESQDQQSWTITLKDGYTFHDGTPVTAQSFVDSWNYGAYGPNAQRNSYFYENIQGYNALQCPDDECNKQPRTDEMSGLRAVDDQTLEVTLSAPFSQFPLTVGYTAFYPMPEAFFAKGGNKLREAPVGNGPFEMDGAWQHNREINVTRYDDFGGEPAKAGAVTFAIYAEDSTAYNDLLAGNLDVMDQLPPEQIESAQAQLGDRYLEGESSSYTYIGFDVADPRFSDERLRQAFSMAVDRESITETILPDQVPAGSIVSPVVAGSRPDACGDLCDYNPGMAKKLFDQAGGYDGELVLWLNSGAGHEVWMEAVSNQLRQNLGISDISFESLTFAPYLDALDDGSYTGPFRLGWIMDYPSPQNYLEPIYSTDGSSNYFNYSNPQVDSLIDKGNAADTVKDGIEFYQQAEDIILEEMPSLPMFFGRVAGGHSENVDGVIVDAFDRVNTADIEVTGG
ncbi:MAG: ABC transporter substrate-binding protein [Actinomycetota bacterium]|nr:ABC transporter substrate-binding protein [Actinomycetota bacterium]